MKYIPILFSTAMVQAQLENRKTLTRRTKGLEEINKNPDDWQFEWADYALKKPWRFTQKSSLNEESLKNRNFNQAEIACPYGKVGDVLWVRESSNQRQDEIAYKASPELFKKTRWYKEIQSAYKVTSLEMPEGLMPKMKPSIHMPKAACRIFLKIKSIRVERLQDIDQEDAKAEGILYYDDGVLGRRFKDYDADASAYGYPDHDYPTVETARDSFFTLWQKINGNWNANPWVWVIEFENIEKPADFLTHST